MREAEVIVHAYHELPWSQWRTGKRAPLGELSQSLRHALVVRCANTLEDTLDDAQAAMGPRKRKGVDASLAFAATLAADLGLVDLAGELQAATRATEQGIASSPDAPDGSYVVPPRSLRPRLRTRMSRAFRLRRPRGG